MGILIIILIVLCIYRIQLSGFHEDYISKESTNSVKGIFTIIILYSHLRGYLPPPSNDNALIISDSYKDALFYSFINLFGQMMVVMFLFYSGYGIIISYKNKENYKDGFFKQRFLKILINFDIALVIYALLAIILDRHYSFSQYILSLIGWESIGNSNWFVFVILILYLLTLASLHLISKKNMYYIPWVMYLVSIALIGFLHFTKELSYWYDTILAFPTGMLYATYKSKVETLFRPVSFRILLFLLCTFGFVIFTKYGGTIGNISRCILFSLVIILFSTFIKIDNKILRWLGTQCFAIYILQRIPMIIYSEFGLNNNWILFSIAVIPTTLFLAYIFTLLTNKINYRIFTK